SDPVDLPPNNFLAVKFTLPVGFKGTIKDGATTITNASAPVSTADIAAGLVTYTPIVNDGADPNYTNFQFQVQDDGGTANSGVDLSAQSTIAVRLIVAN